MKQANKDSKELWLTLKNSIDDYVVTLGKATAQGYINDPRHLGFVAARYKFCAKMLAGCASVLEVGCCDAFGSPIVAQTVDSLICTDIDNEAIEDNIVRCKNFNNISFEYFDFRNQPYKIPMDGIYLVDVLEHIFPEEEASFLNNITLSLKKNGIAIIGTPNITAEQYASKYSRMGHVNVKSHDQLKNICSKHFNNVFMFGMNDEMLHTGYMPMAHYLWALCTGPK